MARKPHPSSVLKTLPDEDQAALYDYLRGKTLAEGVQWLFSNNGVRTNDSSLSDWRSWYAMTQEINAWNTDVEELKQLLRTDSTIDPNLIPKIGEAVFISRAAKQGDAKTFAAVASIIQRHKELENQQHAHSDRMQLEDKKLKRKDRGLDQAEKKLAQAERRIAALEAQAEAAKKTAEKAKEALKSGGMDEATRQQLMEEMDRMILGTTAAKAKVKEQEAT
jgi:hypothetical protein